MFPRLISAPPRPLEAPAPGLPDRLFLGLLAGLLVAVWATHADYGISFDEPSQNDYGILILRWYLSGFRDWSALTYKDLANYGGLVEAVLVGLSHHSPLGAYETRHLLGGLLGVWGVLGIYKLGRLLGGGWMGLAAGCLWGLLPSVYGHMFINSKDIPLAGAFIWSLYYLVAARRALPRPGWSLVARLGLCLGVALGVRPGGLLLWGYLGLCALAWASREGWVRRSPAAGARALVRLGLGVVLPACALAYGVALLGWPALAADPLGQIPRALGEGGRYSWGHTVPQVLWLLLVKVPLVHWALALAGLGAGIAALARRGGPGSAWPDWALMAFAGLFPLAYLWWGGVRQYDNIRHSLFLLPSLALLAAQGSVSLGRWAAARGRAAVAGLALVLTALALPPLHALYALHPYQYVYFNELVGGVAGAEARGLDTDYWVTSYREAALELVRRLRAQEGAALDRREVRVCVLGCGLAAGYYLPANFRLVDPDQGWDYLVTHTHEQRHLRSGGQTWFTVRRMGADICYVKRAGRP